MTWIEAAAQEIYIGHELDKEQIAAIITRHLAEDEKTQDMRLQAVALAAAELCERCERPDGAPLDAIDCLDRLREALDALR